MRKWIVRKLESSYRTVPYPWVVTSPTGMRLYFTSYTVALEAGVLFAYLTCVKNEEDLQWSVVFIDSLREVIENSYAISQKELEI
jgi:hypothetical protein